MANTNMKLEEVLKDVYSAINRNDVLGALQFFHPEIERVEPEGFPSSGTYRGLTEFEKLLSQGRGSWAEGACEPEQVITAGDKVIVLVHVRVRLKNQIEWIDARIADGFMFKDGKIILMRTFVEREQALQWVSAGS